MSKQHDFTKGSIARGLIAFSIPFLLSNILQALYGAVDMLVVGRFSAADPDLCSHILSGVNYGSQITQMVAMMVSGLTVSGTVMVGQYIGAKSPKDASETVGTMFTALFVAAMVLTVAVIALAEPLLHLLLVPKEAFQSAKDYLNICMSGTVFIFGYNAISSIQRGMGDSVRPLIFVGVATVINIVLDLVFVKNMGMGAAGAAWATLIAQAVSFLMAVLYLSRKKFIFDFKLRSFHIHAEKLKMIFKLGIPSSIQSIVVNLSFLVLVSVVNYISGDQAVYAGAAIGIVGKFNSFAILPGVAMSSAISAYAAQNIGANKLDRAEKSLSIGIAIAFSLGLAIFALAQFFPETIMRAFIDSEKTIQLGMEYLHPFSFDYLIVPVMFCMNGLILGSGHTLFTLLTASLSSLLLRIPVAYFLGRTSLGLVGVGIAAPAASFCSLVLATWFVWAGRWRADTTGIGRGHKAHS